MIKASAGLSGGPSLQRKIKGLEGKRFGPDVIVGIVKTARYPRLKRGKWFSKDPPTVAKVAFWQEFGTKGGASGGGWGGPVPSRPFMRNSVNVYLKDQGLKKILRKWIDPANPVLGEQAAHELGLALQAIMRLQITHPIRKYKKNRPVTIAIKKSDTPLIDTGLLRRSIDYEVQTKK